MAANGEHVTTRLPVLIIGAGGCGLAFANGLKNAGIPYRVLEREAAIAVRHGRDWALALHWSTPALAKLVGPEHWKRFNEAQIDPNLPTKEMDLIKVINGRTGETLNELPFPRFERLNRCRFRKYLAEGINIEYNKRLERFEVNNKNATGKTVTAYFDDGTSVEGRLLVGADGVHSVVRHQLLPSPASTPRRLPYAATFINASYTAEQAKCLRSYHPLFSTILHPDSMMGMMAVLDAPHPDKPEDWVFTFYIGWQSSIEEQDAEVARSGGVYDKKFRWQQVREKSRAFADPLKSAFGWLDEAMESGRDEHIGVYWGGVSNWDPTLEGHIWDNQDGLVTLAGDAAHPMTYNRGQGINHAIVDVANLCSLLSGSAPALPSPPTTITQATNGTDDAAGSEQQQPLSQKTMIDNYEAEMRKRGGDEVRLSEMNTHMLHDWEKVQQSPLIKKGVAMK